MASIELPAAVVARLAEQAKAEGLSFEAYLEKLAESRSVENEKPPRLTGEELDRLLDVEAGHDSTYQGSYSRTMIYLDHD